MRISSIFVALLIMAPFLKSQDALDARYITHRPPTVAGSFYPADPDELKRSIYQYLDTAERKNLKQDIFAIVAPHAGYVYSGWVAGKAYRELMGHKFDAIIILGPSHHKAFRGASVFNGEAYTTPLGIAKVDQEMAVEIAKKQNLINLSLNGHEWKDTLNEHSIEVQVPFLQVVLPDVPIVPISIGTQDNQTIDAVARSIVNSLKKLGKKALIVASTDLSHFHNLDSARDMDHKFVETFIRYDYYKLSNEINQGNFEACGAGPVMIAMKASEMMGATETLPVFYSTSANSPGIKTSSDRVVGYFSGLIINGIRDSYALPDFTDQEKTLMLQQARKSLEFAAKGDSLMPSALIPRTLSNEYASFVTLKKSGKLRGCMGHTYATKPVIFEITESARLAALRDPRFEPVKQDELNDVKIEITLLSRFRLVNDLTEIVAGTDGAYLKLGRNSGLFLPQVASENNWDRTKFLEELGLKAGLTKDAYLDPNAEIYRFRTVKFSE